MEKILMERTSAGNDTLEYYLVTDLLAGRRHYGVEIRSSRGDSAQVCGVTVSMDSARTLLELLARNTVTPVTLRDVIDDWLA